MKNYSKTIVLTLTICTLILTSCKKKETITPEPEPAPANGTAMLHLHTNIDTNEVDTYGSVYVMAGGRKISVDMSQLYLSNIQLIKADGGVVDISGLNILKVMEVEAYMLGEVPAGNYKSIRFNVGLSAATNSAIPALNDSTLNKPAMWFGATAQPLGYVFTNFQGKIDTTTAANGTVAQMQSFAYKIGTNAHLTAVTMPNQNYTIVSNQTQFIHVVIDYSQLFNGITLNVSSNLSVNSAASNSTALATQIANNIPNMFVYGM